MSTYIDFKKFEGSVHLASDRRRGIWAQQTLLRGSKTVRNAVQFPTTMSAHSLLVVGLQSSLKEISRAHVANLLRDVKDANVTKPRLVVISTNETFGDALQALMSGQQNQQPLRAGKNFLRELARQLARFTVTFKTDTENTTCFSLKNWAVRTLPDPKLTATIPQSLAPCLAPCAVSAVV